MFDNIICLIVIAIDARYTLSFASLVDNDYKPDGEHA